MLGKGQAVCFQYFGAGFQADFRRCIGRDHRSNGGFAVDNLPPQGITAKGGLVPGLGSGCKGLGRPCDSKEAETGELEGGRAGTGRGSGGGGAICIIEELFSSSGCLLPSFAATTTSHPS